MADALASGASVRKDVGVQVPPRAPIVGYLRQAAAGAITRFCETEISFGEPVFRFNVQAASFPVAGPMYVSVA